MDDEEAVAAVLVAPQLTRFRRLCDVDGPIQPRFDGYTKHVLLADDRAAAPRGVAGRAAGGGPGLLARNARSGVNSGTGRASPVSDAVG